jgi:O-antigen ligase
VLILTGARAPLACALVVSGMTLLTVRSRMVPLRHRLFLVAGAGMLLPLLLLIAGDLAFVRLFNVLSNETGNLSGRELLWPAFQAVAEESPWFGWGLGAGNVIIPPEGQIAQVLHTWAAHNEYLRMQVEGGHIGRSLLIVLFILWARSNTAGLPAGDRRIMRLAFLAFAAHAYTDNVLISTPACVLFAFATAVFARGRHDRADRSALPGAGEVA